MQSGLSKKEIISIFTLKVFAGLLTGLISYYYYNSITDYILFNDLGKIETDNLINHPKIFFTDIINYDKLGSFWGSGNSFWKDLGYNIILKMLGFFNILSRGNYYINVLFFNVIGFYGTIALISFFNKIYSGNKKSILIGCVLLPSTLYFCSAIHKDLLIITCLSFFLLALYNSLITKFTSRRIITLIICATLILLIRNYIGLILITLSVLLIAFYKLRKYFYSILESIFGLIIIAFIAISISNKNENILRIITDKQSAFINLGKSNTDYNYIAIQPELKSIVLATPSAIRHSYFSPLPFEFNKIIVNFFSLELCIYILLFILALFYNKEKLFSNIHPFTFYLQLLTFLIFIIIGLTITNAGSLIRYRSIFLPFLVIPILCNIDWNRLKSKRGCFKNFN